MNTIKKTGLSFGAGTKLSAEDLNKMNNTINAIVDVVNGLLMSCFDVNLELNRFDLHLDLFQAINIVAENRRQRGMKIRFLSQSGSYVEYSYLGESLSDADFLNVDNWITGVEVVDGGEF